MPTDTPASTVRGAGGALRRLVGALTILAGVAWTLAGVVVAAAIWLLADDLGGALPVLLATVPLLAAGSVIVVLGLRLVRQQGRRAELVAGVSIVLLSAGLLGLGLSSVFRDNAEESTFVDFDTSDASPAWSPRGETIAFVSNRGRGGLFLIRSDGHGIRRISTPGGSNLAWSPDGTKLALERDDGLYVVGAKGGAPTRLLRVRGASEPAWSPDGKWIAFSKELPDLSTAIYIVPANGGQARRLAPPPLPKSDPRWSIAAVSEEHPTWSPDGRRIAYEAEEAIFVMNADGSNRKRVTDGREGSYEPSWSPDGRRIAYQCEGGLCVIEPTRPDHRHRLSGDGGSPSWSPDSKRIVYTRYLYGGTGFFSHPSSLSIVSVTGGSARKLTFGP